MIAIAKEFNKQILKAISLTLVILPHLFENVNNFCEKNN